MYVVISLLVLRAGYGICLYQFLIIAYLFTFLTTTANVKVFMKANVNTEKLTGCDIMFLEKAIDKLSFGNSYTY